MINPFNFSNTVFYTFFNEYCHGVERTKRLAAYLSENPDLERKIFEHISSHSEDALPILLESLAKTSSIFSYYTFRGTRTEAFLRDLTLIIKGPPTYRSVRGIASGVTFINGEPNKLLFKWTDYNEYVCQKIYRLFLEIINDPHIQTPRGRFIYEHRIPALKWLEKPVPDPRTKKAPTCLMLYEKAPGACFIDFVPQKYNLLGPDKKALLFQMIGKVAMIDLVLGHQDRFFKLELPLESSRLIKMREADYGEYANLGNLLVNINEEDNLCFHLIDNGAYIDDQKIKYVTSFFKYRDDPKTSSPLITIMTEQMVEALNRAKFPDEVEVTKQMRDNIESFKHDLIEYKLAIHEGIYKMTQTLQERFKDPRCYIRFKNLKPALKLIEIDGSFLTRINACKTRSLVIEEKAAVASA